MLPVELIAVPHAKRIPDVWPGVVLSIALWLAIAALWSNYLKLTNYSFFYAGLSQLMVAMIFFQFTAIAVLIGAELNRGIIEVKKMRRAASEKSAMQSASPS